MGHSGTEVKRIWGPCQRSQAEAGDRALRRGAGADSSVRAFMQERLGVGDGEEREASWGILSQDGAEGILGVYADHAAGVWGEQVPGRAFQGLPKGHAGMGGREKGGELAWALPASSLLRRARWDRQFCHPPPRSPNTVQASLDGAGVCVW